MNFSDIRIALKDKIKEDPYGAFHVKSNLCWYRYELYAREMAHSLPVKTKKILDVGCGWGHVSAILSKLRPDLEIYATDLRPSVSWKRLKKFNVKYDACDATKIKFKNESFDAVMSLGLLEHIPEYNKFLREVNRILKPEGVFYIFNLPNKFSIPEFIAKNIGIFYHECKFTQSEIVKVLAENGFETLSIRLEALIPSQVGMISKSLGGFFDKNYVALQKLDDVLTKTPLRIFSEAITIVCKKL